MPSEHDVTIMWDNKPTYNRFRVALEIQDAGNLRAIAREFVKVVDTAMEATRDTVATWHDPAVVMFVGKLASLCNCEADFSAAYDECRKRSNHG